MLHELFYIDELNTEQKKAVQLKDNAVVSAGAGSGKTKVLAKRFVYLILERNIKIEKILALTFTKKAASEMYDRIYKELIEVEAKLTDKYKKLLAGEALKNFTKANIGTLDSFCSMVARNGCSQFGISPDFNIAKNQSDKLAKEVALNFFMKHRNNKNIISLISGTNLEDFIFSFFEAFLKYVLITKPIDIEENKKLFIININNLFSKSINTVQKETNTILLIDDSNKKDGLLSPLKEIILSFGNLPTTLEKSLDNDFINLLEKFSAIDLRKGNKKDELLYNARKAASNLRDLSRDLVSIQNTFTKKDFVFELFDLLDQLQQKFITKKITENILSYADVAQLAVDALLYDIDLRNFYKNEFDSIMIDEFQDNNNLQRNLLFLISEKKDLQKKQIPKSLELEKDKLFFVGDDKQSIYLFRGADVSVFKKLDSEFKFNESASLDINYRSEKSLIVFFNELFKNIFLDNKSTENSSEIEKNILEHEANFSEIKFFNNTENVKPSVKLCIAFNNLNDGEQFLNVDDTEAFTLVKEIIKMVENKVTVRHIDKKNIVTYRPCKFSDFAILFRVTTHQNTIEKYLRQMGVPYKTVQQKGIFNDAPINDIISIIKLALHPNDFFTYAQVLRSPFSKLDDIEITKLLLQYSDMPFEFNKNDFSNETQNKINSLQELFFRVLKYTHENTCAEIISKLWYDESYRYIILQNENYKRYMELYDYLFEIARLSDNSENSVEDFIQTVENYISQDTKLNDMEIPVEVTDYDNSVKLLTIHKSKGLEFPIVCLPFCASDKKTTRLTDKVLYSKELGLSISLKSDTETGNKNENIFFNDAKSFEDKKEVAELKRLLYVALTRSESHIIMTGIKSSRSKDATNIDFKNQKDLFNAMCENFSLKKADGSSKTELSFYDLIISAIKCNETFFEKTKDIFQMQEIKPIPTKEPFIFLSSAKHAKEKSTLKKSQINENTKTSIEKINYIVNASCKTFKVAEKKFFTASNLDDTKQFYQNSNEEKQMYFDTAETENISATELGTLTHATIAARLNKKDFTVPESEREKILLWTENFFSSKLGALATKSKNIKTEYGIITKYEGKTVVGKIDLLFESDSVLYIIDYKTDKYEKPSEHKTQLEVYKKACTNLFEKSIDKIKAFVFYLRTGNVFEI